jgi:hypothetical protein
MGQGVRGQGYHVTPGISAWQFGLHHLTTAGYASFSDIDSLSNPSYLTPRSIATKP